MDVRPRYKQTEVGLIPEEWGVEALGKSCAIVTKGTTPTTIGRTFARSGVAFLKAESISENGTTIPERVAYIDATTHTLMKRSQLRSNDVLISIAGVLGRVGLVEESDLPANTNQALAIVRLGRKSQLERRFLFYALRSPCVSRQIRDINVQAAQANISLQNVKDFLLPTPPKAEQRAIATALSDVDALLGGLDRLIAKKRDLKQAALQQLLTGQTRLPGFHGEWEVKPLGQTGTWLKGSGVKKDEANSGELPCIRYGEIYTHHNDYVGAFNSWISSKVAATATRLRQGDLLFAGSGETKEEIGKCVAFVDDCEAFAGGDILILRLARANSMFMGYYCNSAPINAQKASKAQGDAVVHISAAALSSVEVRLPSNDEQVAIAAVLNDMDAELAALTARRDKTRNLKQAVMQELLSGKTRLVPALAAHA